jgi:predicted transposase YbfD/YdcC
VGRRRAPAGALRAGRPPRPLTGHRTVPSESTIRRTLGRVDDQALAAAVGAWLCDLDRRHRQDRRAVAVDGKTLRGAKQPPDGRQLHLLAAMDHTTRTVLAQRAVDGAPGEVPGFAPLLDPLDLAGVVVTADALHTHAEAAEFLVTEKHAHYLFTVKANQPTLLACCAGLPWRDVPVLDRTRDRAHGRVVAHPQGRHHHPRRLPVRRPRPPGYPQDPRPPGQPRRSRTVVVYAITSLPFAQASPARLADLLRGHWAIENGLHHVRDTTYAEDACQLPTGTAPQVMATLRNLAIGVLGRAGPVNLAAALRPPRPRPHPAPGDPRDHARMNGHSERTPGPVYNPLRSDPAHLASVHGWAVGWLGWCGVAAYLGRSRVWASKGITWSSASL